MENKKNLSRKEFLSYSAMVGSVAAFGSLSPMLTSCGSTATKDGELVPLKAVGEYYVPNLPDIAPDGKELKVALVGCGGRGSGAVENILAAANGLKVVALGDVFADRVEGVKKMLVEKYKIEVPAENCFVGFDAYQKVCDTDADIVLFCTPPVFRPMHYKYAVEKGKHTFLEKPVAVDPAGYRTLISAAKNADMKGLSCVTGTQRHHQRPYVESFKKIQEGLIGEITGGNVYWNGGMLWYKERQPGWSNMEWMIRDWVNWKWLSGDHIVEQHVHNIDIFNWMTGKKPISATGMGSRQRRVTGDQYDNFTVDFDYGNGVHLCSMCRQIDGCSNSVTEKITGTKGFWQIEGGKFVIRDLQGNSLWEYDVKVEEEKFKQNNPYVLEHVNLIETIRAGKQINQTVEIADSTLCGIMGRESAYTGKTITWDEAISSELDMM
ncbi:MAG: Gfo/Idh/MocA family oxidoreductase, partial [Rikenellaceae bacterium]